MTPDLARLRAFFESTLDAIISVDESQTVVQANPAAARMFRIPLDELVGSPLERFIPERFRSGHRLYLLAFNDDRDAARRMGRQRDTLALRADGEEFAVESTVSVATVDGQRMFTVVHRDVNERRQAEMALHDSRARLESALGSIQDAVAISDREGRLVQYNEAFATFHRFPSKAACVQSLTEFERILEVFTPEGRPAPPDQWAVPRAIRGEHATNAELRLRRRDTGESWIGSYSFAPIRSESGAITGAVVTARDITEQRGAMLDLLASQAALQGLIASQDRVQEEERTRIARDLHDDLQQTLSAMRMSLAELAKVRPASQAELRARVAELEALAIQAIASTRRTVAGLRPLMLEQLGLVPALRERAEQFALHTGMSCRVNAADGLHEALLGAPILSNCLYRVVQEALNNVAKHAHATRVRVDLALLPDDTIDLKVEDNGSGIRKLDRQKARSFGIVGMHERVRAQGGSLRVEALEAGGTRVWVQVPLRAAGPPAADVDRALEAHPARRMAPGPVDAGTADHGASVRAWMESETLDRLVTRTAGQTLQTVIDAMGGNVAVLDGRGDIRFVNQRWCDFAVRNGAAHLSEVGPGLNYLAVCQRSARQELTAAEACEGLRRVIEDRLSVFSMDYPCHAPHELRWFRLYAIPMSNGDALVEHVLLESQAREPAQRGG